MRALFFGRNDEKRFGIMLKLTLSKSMAFLKGTEGRNTAAILLFHSEFRRINL